MNKIYNIFLNLSNLILPLFVILVTYFKELNIMYKISICIIVVFLFIISYFPLFYAKKKGEHFTIGYETFEEVRELYFIVISILIPIASKQFDLSNITINIMFFIGVIIFLIIKPFVYNPLFIIFRFRIYKITTNEGGVYILLSKNKIINNKNKIEVVKIGDYELIQV